MTTAHDTLEKWQQEQYWTNREALLVSVAFSLAQDEGTFPSSVDGDGTHILIRYEGEYETSVCYLPAYDKYLVQQLVCYSSGNYETEPDWDWREVEMYEQPMDAILSAISNTESDY